MPARQRTVIDLSKYPCPACGASNRWEGVRIEKLEHQPPTLTAWCDCALGELVVVLCNGGIAIIEES